MHAPNRGTGMRSHEVPTGPEPFSPVPVPASAASAGPALASSYHHHHHHPSQSQSRYSAHHHSHVDHSSPIQPYRRAPTSSLHAHEDIEPNPSGHGAESMYYAVHQQHHDPAAAANALPSTSTLTFGRNSMAAPGQQYSAVPAAPSSHSHTLYDRDHYHSQQQQHEQQGAITSASYDAQAYYSSNTTTSSSGATITGGNASTASPSYAHSPVSPVFPHSAYGHGHSGHGHGHGQYASPIPAHSHAHVQSHTHTHARYSTPPPQPTPLLHPVHTFSASSSSNATAGGAMGGGQSSVPTVRTVPQATVGTGSAIGNSVTSSTNVDSSPVPRLAYSEADIGSYVTFASGPFAGRTVRAELTEIQKADLGRKCADPPTSANSVGGASAAGGANAERNREKDRAIRDKDGGGSGPRSRRSQRSRSESEGASVPDGAGDGPAPAVRNVRKDRRPLDPPPVVKLRFFEAVEYGTPRQHEREVLADDIAIGGLICDMDLFRVTIPPSPLELAHMGLGTSGPIGPGFAQDPVAASARLASVTSGGYYTTHDQQHRRDSEASSSPLSPVRQVGLYPSGTGGGIGEEWHGDGGSPVSPVSASGGNYPYPPSMQSTGASAPIDVDALPPPRPEDLASSALFGQKYTHAASILDMQGQNAIIFVFSDISVKLEGLFRPRYRFFDLFSRTEHSQDVHVLAETLGGVFAVYSTKEFPGLRASTPLTKHLSRWGIHVNIRETERRRRVQKGIGGAGAGGAGGGGGAGASSGGTTGGRRGAPGRRTGKNGGKVDRDDNDDIDDDDDDRDNDEDDDNIGGDMGELEGDGASVGSAPSKSGRASTNNLSLKGRGSNVRAGGRRPVKKARRGSGSGGMLSASAGGSGSGGGNTPNSVYGAPRVREGRGVGIGGAAASSGMSMGNRGVDAPLSFLATQASASTGAALSTSAGAGMGIARRGTGSSSGSTLGGRGR